MKLILTALLSSLMLAANAANAETFEEGLRLKTAGQIEAAAAAFSAALARNPNDSRTLEQLAIVQGWLEQYDASITSWRRLIARTPEAAAAHTGLARILYWQGDRAAALAAVNVALQLEPDNVEALTLKGDIQLANGQRNEARASFERVRALAGDSEELERKLAASAEPLRWRIDFGLNMDNFSALRTTENTSFTQVGYRASDATTWYFRGERFDNFGAVDSTFSTGIYHLFNPKLLLQAELGFTPDDVNFRPSEMLSLNGDVLLNGPIQPLIGLRYARYDQGLSQGDVWTATPGVRILTGWSNIELRHGVSRNLDDSTTGVSQLKLIFERTATTYYTFAAVGREASPPLPVAKLRVIGAGISHALTPAWSIRMDLAYEDRRNTYERGNIGFGMSFRF
jgi:YaiO family outer membrane protein